MPEPLESVVRIAPAVWPGKPLDIQPGDLAKFLPHGMGIGAPAVMMPWDDLSAVFSRGDYYGFQTPSMHPFLNAPLTDPAGGIVYLGRDFDAAELATLLGLLEVRTQDCEYAAFVGRSEDPKEDRFLVQMRIVGKYGVAGLFGAALDAETEGFVAQEKTVGEAIAGFIDQQRDEWGEGYSPELRGTFGGDGDWAKEKLAFGVMVENAYHQVYRVWSRAWLVTK